MKLLIAAMRYEQTVNRRMAGELPSSASARKKRKHFGEKIGCSRHRREELRHSMARHCPCVIISEISLQRRKVIACLQRAIVSGVEAARCGSD